MEIAAITRYKHGGIVRALRKLGWPQIELARRAGFAVGDFINMRQRPTQAKADKIQAVFGEEGEYVDILGAWPEDFKMTAAPVIVSYGEVDVLQLESREPLHLESVEQLQVCLDGISEDQRELLEDVYIHGTTQSALAKKYKISSSAVACRVEKAKWDARRAWRRESTKDEKPWRGKVETCDHVNPIDRYYSRILNRVK